MGQTSNIVPMVSEKYILKKFEKRSLQEQVDILLKALDYMKADNRRNQAGCIALAMGIPLFPKVIAVEDVDDYKVLLTFNNGENRLIDFRQFFSPEKKI